jgi:hypothetical protein
MALSKTSAPGDAPFWRTVEGCGSSSEAGVAEKLEQLQVQALLVGQPQLCWLVWSRRHGGVAGQNAVTPGAGARCVRDHAVFMVAFVDMQR